MTWAVIMESDRDDPCCFRRALVADDFETEDAAVACAGAATLQFPEVSWFAIEARKLGQRLPNGHVRLVSEGTVDL